MVSAEIATRSQNHKTPSIIALVECDFLSKMWSKTLRISLIVIVAVYVEPEQGYAITLQKWGHIQCSVDVHWTLFYLLHVHCHCCGCVQRTTHNYDSPCFPSNSLAKRCVNWTTTCWHKYSLYAFCTGLRLYRGREHTRSSNQHVNPFPPTALFSRCPFQPLEH